MTGQDALPVNKLLLNVLEGQSVPTPPVWMMRQAGRYLPEYRELRAKAGSFLDLCFNPDWAADVTLQPIRRFGFDAAILFSDILVIPLALGQAVTFEAGEGPRLPALKNAADIAALKPTADQTVLDPIYQTIAKVKASLPSNVTFLGFCGAPWTVATYMIAGQGTPDQAPARMFAYEHRADFQALIDRLVQASIDYLTRQFFAGVDAVQLFDSWAGVLPAEEFERWCVAPAAQIVEGVRRNVPRAKVIGFPRGVGDLLTRYTDKVAVDAVSLDWTADRQKVRAETNGRIALQGNLDPLALLAGGAALDEAVDAILADLNGAPFIFNLGHGILPQTPIAHVERMLARVRR